MKTKDFNGCVDQYADGLFRFARRMLGNSVEAEDVVQQVFEKFWLKRNKVSIDKAKSYLFTSTYNLCIDLVRKRKLSQQAHLNVSDPVERPDAFVIRDAIQEALDTLTPIQRTVVLLRDFEGYSYEEIGQMTELNTSQVKVYIFRARKKLQVQLKHYRYA